MICWSNKSTGWLIGALPVMKLIIAGFFDINDLAGLREAKQYTSWLNPNEDYEQAVGQFVLRCLDVNARSPFLKDFTGFEKRQLLNEMDAMLAKRDFDRPLFISSLLENMDDGRIKLFIVMQTLRFRHHYAALFRNGEYLKINIHGIGSDQLLVFARKDQNNFAIIIIPRFMERLLNLSLDDVWADTWLELPKQVLRHYQELFSQYRVTAKPVEEYLQLYVRDILKLFPIAILSASPIPGQSKK
jgi:(1->4)-alpha-D-glucan 1-alpha-D-glucosylmutase